MYFNEVEPPELEEVRFKIKKTKQKENEITMEFVPLQKLNYKSNQPNQTMERNALNKIRNSS